MKRFMNRVRFLAMRRRAQEEYDPPLRWLTRRVKRLLRLTRDPQPPASAVTPREQIPEDVLIAWASVQRLMGERYASATQDQVLASIPAGHDDVRVVVSNRWNLLQRWRPAFMEVAGGVDVR
jgi:hypothetical protein